jgi:phosphate transport system substrate-binding protein
MTLTRPQIQLLHITSLFLITVFLLGCSSDQKETTTRGRLFIPVAESLAPTMMAEIHGFLALYQANGATITQTIVPAKQAINHFIHDSARIVILPYALTKEEKEYMQRTYSDLNEIIIAYDGIAVIVHSSNRIERLTTSEIKKILAGSISQWNQIRHARPIQGHIRVYCQDASDVIEYLRRRLLTSQDSLTRFTHTPSDLHTIQAVEKDPTGLGFVSIGWIDSLHPFLNVLQIGRTAEDTDTTFLPPSDAMHKFFAPHPAYIHLNYYPFKRSIYMYTRSRGDLAAGFGTFIATSEGQNIIKQHNLVPGTQKIIIRSVQP